MAAFSEYFSSANTVEVRTAPDSHRIPFNFIFKTNIKPMYIRFVLLYLAVQYLSIFVNVIKGNSIAFYCGASTRQRCVFICLLLGICVYLIHSLIRKMIIKKLLINIIRCLTCVTLIHSKTCRGRNEGIKIKNTIKVHIITLPSLTGIFQ